MDTVVTPEFWNKLRHGPGYLRAMEGGHPRALHRMVRIDAGESVPPSLAPIETATWLKNHIFRAWSVGSRSMRLGNYSSAEVQEGLQLVYRLSPAAILNYSEANGDFQLMTRQVWQRWQRVWRGGLTGCAARLQEKLVLRARLLGMVRRLFCEFFCRH